MNTDKEIAAFVDRINRRLNDSPKGSRRGRHRAAFIAVRPLIEGALRGGQTLKATWESLREEGKLSMTYETFRGYCRRMELAGGPLVGSAEDSQAREVRPPAKPTPDELCAPARESAPVTRATHPAAASDARGFRHERVPRTDRIYG